jgi:hypothetical protein
LLAAWKAARKRGEDEPEWRAKKKRQSPERSRLPTQQYAGALRKFGTLSLTDGRGKGKLVSIFQCRSRAPQQADEMCHDLGVCASSNAISSNAAADRAILASPA